MHSKHLHFQFFGYNQMIRCLFIDAAWSQWWQKFYYSKNSVSRELWNASTWHRTISNKWRKGHLDFCSCLNLIHVYLLRTKDLGPLHTRVWEPVTITLQALSLVEKAELGQVPFTLRLRDQQSMWMQDGCKVSTWIPTWHRMDHVSWSLGLFSKSTSWR